MARARKKTQVQTDTVRPGVDTPPAIFVPITFSTRRATMIYIDILTHRDAEAATRVSQNAKNIMQERHAVQVVTRINGRDIASGRVRDW